MKKTFFAIVYFVFFQFMLFASPSFPQLTGRIVDTANILTSNEKASLTKILENHEKESSNQIVVVILNSLEGYDIADFSYQLGRHWGIGQKDKNNGVLLVVSMAEKKIRIEVGYGLEGVLTDKTAGEIIEYIIKPKFRESKFYEGVEAGVLAIIKAIEGEYKSSDYKILTNSSENFFFIYFAIIFLSGILRNFVKNIKSNVPSKIFHSTMLAGFAGAFAIGFLNSIIISIIVFIVFTILIFIFTKKVTYQDSSSNGWESSSTGGFSSRGGSFSGGFSGGGGSFGGGGASGGW